MSRDEQLEALARDVTGRLMQVDDTYGVLLAETIARKDVEVQAAAITAIFTPEPKQLEGQEYLEAAKRGPRLHPIDGHWAEGRLGFHEDVVFQASGTMFHSIGLAATSSLIAFHHDNDQKNLLSRESLLRMFALEWVNQLRLALCKSRKPDVRLDAVAATMAAAACHSLGMSEPVAIGVATLFIITVLKVTKTAFCKMSDMEILDELKQRAELSKKAPDPKRRVPRSNTKKSKAT
jgi:hypothetical protein